MNLDAIWDAAVAAMNKMRHGGEKVTRADLDAYVHDETKGQITSFAELARVRTQHANIAAGQEQQDIKTPSALQTAGMGIANGMALGIPAYQASRSSDPADHEVGDFMAAGAEANPKSDFFGNLGGGAVAGAVSAGAALPATSAAVDALPIVSKLPGLFRTGLAGGLATAPAAGVQAATAGGGPKDIAEAMALSTALGIPLSMVAGWQAARYNPAPHLAGRAVQEAAPGIPNFAAGKAALASGETTPMRVGNPDLGIVHQPVSETAAAQLPEPLRPRNFEKAPSMRTLASKEVTKSAEATAQAENALRSHLQDVIDGKRAIQRDLQTGYDALLEGRPIQSQQAIDLYKQQTGSMEPPTARQLFNLSKKLEQKADQAFTMNKKGTGAPDLDLAEQQGETAKSLRAILGEEVPGFNDLQAKVAPWMARQREVQASMRSIVGRAVKPIGKTAPTPKGGLEEGVQESLGYEPTQIEEESARKLVNPLFKSSDTQDVLDLISSGGLLNSKLRFGPGAKTGAIAGAASSKSKYGQKVRGLLSWPLTAAQ